MEALLSSSSVYSLLQLAAKGRNDIEGSRRWYLANAGQGFRALNLNIRTINLVGEWKHSVQ